MLLSVRFFANPIFWGGPTYDHLLNSSKLFALSSLKERQKRGRTWVKVSSLPYLWPASAIFFLTPLLPLCYHSISGREHLQDPLANRWILYFTTKKQKEYVTGEFNDILDEGKKSQHIYYQLKENHQYNLWSQKTTLGVRLLNKYEEQDTHMIISFSCKKEARSL